jgi:hypothetical protein
MKRRTGSRSEAVGASRREQVPTSSPLSLSRHCHRARIMARAQGLGFPAISGDNVRVLRETATFTLFPCLLAGDFSSERRTLQTDT